jgi:hypothetical protein
MSPVREASPWVAADAALLVSRARLSFPLSTPLLVSHEPVITERHRQDRQTDRQMETKHKTGGKCGKRGVVAYL